MKIRIHKNSIRLRLSQSEVRDFQEKSCIEERLEFGPDMLNSFRCALVREDKAQAITARYLPGVIEILVPREMADRWVSSDSVGIEGTYLAGEKPIAIAIEKDFQCLHRDSAEDADAYPNPAAQTKASA